MKKLSHNKVTKIMQSYGNISLKGAMKYFCGKQLNYGCSRKVYEFKHDPHYVVKLEYTDDSFNNVKEWLIWCEIMGCEAIAKWFAPMVTINAIGNVALQERVQFDR